MFDLTALQREANRLYGFTAKQTLDYAQALYEKRLLTYPRTDSKYITSDMQRSTCLLYTSKSLDRRYIGIEINPEYCNLAKQRIGGESP